MKLTFGMAQHLIVRKPNDILKREGLPAIRYFRTPDTWAEHRDQAGNIVTMGKVTRKDLDEIEAAAKQEARGIVQTHTLYLMRSGGGFTRFFGNLCGQPWGRTPVSPTRARSIRKAQLDFAREQRQAQARLSTS